MLLVLDVRGAAPDRPSTLEMHGKEADVMALMPLVLINPEVKGIGDPVAGTEGWQTTQVRSERPSTRVVAVECQARQRPGCAAVAPSYACGLRLEGIGGQGAI